MTLVRLKLTGADAPVTVAVTVYAPDVELAVKVDDLATPKLLVASVSVVVPLAKVPLGPEVGAVKVTLSPPVTTPFVVTVAANGAAKGLPPAALWVVPPVAAMVIVSGCPEPVVVDEVLLPPPQPDKKQRHTPTNANRARRHLCIDKFFLCPRT